MKYYLLPIITIISFRDYEFSDLLAVAPFLIIFAPFPNFPLSVDGSGDERDAFRGLRGRGRGASRLDPRVTHGSVT